MIAYLERLVQEETEVDIADGNDDAISVLRESLDIDGSVDVSPHAIASASEDFGGVQHHKPLAVVRPAQADDVIRVIKLAHDSSPCLAVAARGNGHSINGQSLVAGGIVINMRRPVCAEMLKFGQADGPYVDVWGGTLWAEVLQCCVAEMRLAPRSWTDYLELTVGGTLSNAGVSGQSFRVGPQISNVSELDVVTGKGDIVTCSAVEHPQLFFGCLGGLGQFGVITRARILLEPAPRMVRWIRAVYMDFDHYTRDAEWLITRPEDESFDYVEGFAFANNDDPINGWPSVPMPGSGYINLDWSCIPSNSGGVLYCLEVAVYYQRGDDLSSVDRTLERLGFEKALRFDVDVEYVEFLSRVRLPEGGDRAAHPWLNMFVSKNSIAEFDRTVIKSMLADGVGGPMLVYPLHKSKWDKRTSVVLPDEGEIFYIVCLLRATVPSPGDPPAEILVAQNKEIVRVCMKKGFDYKLYLPHYNSESEWRRHFGSRWGKFVELKGRYDPMHILSPGQAIFGRIQRR